MLTEESTKISPDISPTKTAYMLSQLLEYVGYDESESIPATETVSIEEQNDAIKTLASIIASLNSGRTVEESILIEFEPDDIQLENPEFIPESAVTFIDDLTVNKATEDKQDNFNQINYDFTIILEDEQEENQPGIYEEDIMLYVIPLIMARLISEGLVEDSEDGEIRVYQSDEFTASLQVTVTDEQILILKRRQHLYSEAEVALNAVRKTNYEQFQVTTNQLTKTEIEKFRLIALMEYNQSKQFNRSRQDLGDE